jgi:hypothetical protein
MSTRKELQIALEIITEGAKAPISTARKRKLFGRKADEKMNAIQAKHRKWVGAQSVQALGVSPKETKGRETGELAIVVFVDRKRLTSKLRNPVPRRIHIRGLGWIKTDVSPIGRLEPHDFPNRVRPAMPGCSIGHKDLETYGTFGLLVRKQDDDDARTYVLSNSHVLALDGLASQGDAVVQPGPGDAMGDTDDKIAELAGWVDFDFDTPGFPNKVDAAIARVTRASSVTRKIRVINQVPMRLSSVVKAGMLVHKVGRTTDDFGGKVLCASAKVWVEHRKTPTKSLFAGFDDQVLCERYASPGDSGSAVLNEDNEVIGLHASGTASTCTFNKIDNVFEALNITLA